MPATRYRRVAALAAVMLAALTPTGPRAQTFTVATTEVDDLKAVFGTVESVDTLVARSRTSGTIDGIAIDEGSRVTAGEVIGIVTDDRVPLELVAVDSRIAALLAQQHQAEVDLERAQRLRLSGAVAQATLDDAETAVDVVTAQLAAMEAERSVIAEQLNQGAVLAPGAGRVIEVHAVNGSVVLPGEPIATIASDLFILRLYLPERHARFIAPGDPVLVGAAGLTAGDGDLRNGTIRQVYPQLDRGRVVADAEVEGLGDFFVGERTRVFVSTGRRETLVVPQRYVYRRFGLDYVRLADGTEVVVRLGASQPRAQIDGGVEVLSGLAAGDVVALPEAAP